MKIRSVLQFMLGLLLAVLISAGARAKDEPAGRNQIIIASTADVYSELAPCG